MADAEQDLHELASAHDDEERGATSQRNTHDHAGSVRIRSFAVRPIVHLDDPRG